MTFGPRWSRAGLGALLLLGLFGCSESPLAPPPGGSPANGTAGTGPPLLTVESDGTTQWTPSAEVAKLDTIPAGSRELAVCADINGMEGGRIRCGRFVLAVPAGAFLGTGTICMDMPDSTLMVVDLKIDPPEWNKFLLPVKLCLVTQDASVDEKDVSIYWYDPAHDSWSAMACDRDLSNDLDVTGGLYAKGVLTLLGHFSRYSGGKAGW